MSQVPTQAGPGGASEEAIRAHYDLGNAFFRLWLDQNMVYSAARWTDCGSQAASLEEAQLWKMDWHLDAAGVAPGHHLLDVGAGWGGLMRRAVEMRGAAGAVGLTPSDEQASWIGAGAGELPLRVIRKTWQEATFEKPFEAIVSIGALEHFARPDLRPDDRRQLYEEFFRFCSRNLVPGGRVSLQFISWLNIREGTENANLPTELFPDSALPHVPEVLQALSPRFHVMALENCPSDYSRTLQAWLNAINENRDALIALEGKDQVKRFIRGFRRFILGFEAGTLGLVRISLQQRQVP